MEEYSQGVIMIKYFGLVAIIVLFGLTFEARAQDIGQQFEGFNLQGYTDDGEKSWDVNGATADVMGTKIKLTDVNANAYENQNVNIKADSGIVDQTSGEMELLDDVIVTTDDGAELRTDSLYWNREEDTVSTEDKVLITDDGFTVSGVGLEAQPGMKRSQINHDVRALVDIDIDRDSDGNTKKNVDGKEKQILTITSDGPMLMDQAKLMASFEDNVVAVQANQKLKADRMEVFFNSDMDDVIEIICIGSVEIVQGENKTYASRAVFNRQTQRLTLSGRPKLILLTEGTGAITSFGN
ncbi:MAG: LPS export ABC transporter protein LptC/lipopolysaccharide transport protein LptA [Candidatus Omnitrophota bacterium]|jgi:LPS export ABC transporter protein LptC/lipopolysaccharide transport protein LptA